MEVNLGGLTDILPWLWLPMFPPLRGENPWVGKSRGDGRVQINTALHDNGAITNRGILQDGHGRHAIRPATMGESGVFQSKAYIEWDAGIEAESLVHCVLFCRVNSRHGKEYDVCG